MFGKKTLKIYVASTFYESSGITGGILADLSVIIFKINNFGMTDAS